MISFSSLQLVVSKRSKSADTKIHRRRKFLTRLDEQIALAMSLEAGNTYTPLRRKMILNLETGIRKSVELPKRVKAWWWFGDGGACTLTLRYGSKILTLNTMTGANAIQCNRESLVSTLESVRKAVETGELDVSIDDACAAVRKRAGK
jgi:hypothetical protein